MNENKVIVPIPPRHITEKYVYGPLALSGDQLKVFSAVSVAGVTAVSITSALPFPLNLAGIPAISVLAYAFYRFAWTHERLMNTWNSLIYQYYKKQGMMDISYTDNYNKIKSLFPYQIKDIKNGIISFGNNKFGVILYVKERKLSPEDMSSHISNLELIINSLPPEIIVKIRARTQVRPGNVLQQTVLEQLNNVKLNNQQKELLFSLYDKTKEKNERSSWEYSIFIGFSSVLDQIEPYVQTILPGIIQILENSRFQCIQLKDPQKILSYYVSDLSIYDFKNKDRLPLLSSNNSMWSEPLRQFVPGRIKFEKEYILLNNEVYAGCVLVGIPENLVSGYPENLRTRVLEKLYELSSLKDHIISIDATVMPIDSGYAVDKIKSVITSIEANQHSMNITSNIRQLDNSKSKYLGLMEQLQNGTTRINDFSYIITVYAKSLENLRAGLSKVQAILRAYDIKSRPATNIQIDALKSTRFFPIYKPELSTWIPTNGIARIIPLTTGDSNTGNENGIGVYFGDDTLTNDECIFDLNAMGAMHAIILGATRSGKTTGLAVLGMRAVNAGYKVIYVTVKPDSTTNYLNVASSFADKGEVVFLGRGGKNINPLEIIYDPTRLFNAKDLFFQHLTVVKRFINLLAGGDLNHLQIEYIERTLLALYYSLGYKPDNVESWISEEPPTLLDLHRIWERDSLDNDSPYQMTAQAVYSRTTSIRHNWDFLSTPTTVSLDADYLVIDLSGMPHDCIDPMNYLLTSIFAMRFRTDISKKTIIMIDEGRAFLKSGLGEQIIKIATQGGSQGVGIWLASQNPNDLKDISDEMKNNSTIYAVFGRNIDVDPVINFFKWPASESDYLRSCSAPGKFILAMKEPYSQRYHLQLNLSAKEQEILFGKQDPGVVSEYQFIHKDLEQFAEDEGVIMADWIEGDSTQLKESRRLEFVQRAVGAGKIWAYIKPELIHSGKIGLESIDHYLTVVQIAGYFIQRGYKAVINHNDDVDIIVTSLSERFAIEYQTSAENNNLNDRIMIKWKTGVNKYGKLFFVGDTESVKELRQIIKTDGVVFARGKELTQFLESIISEKQNKKNENVVFVS